MCSLCPHESASGPVMTKRSGGKVHRCLNLSQPPHHSSSAPSPDNTTLSSEVVVFKASSPSLSSSSSSSSKRATVSGPSSPSLPDTPTDSCSSFRFGGAPWSSTLSKVGKVRVRCLLILFLVLSLHSQAAMTQLQRHEQPQHITFKSRLCRPPSQEHLRNLMGSSFDERRMATDTASAQRQFGYQGDDPYAGEVDTLEEEEEEEILASGENLWLREEEIFVGDREFDEVARGGEESALDRRWSPGKDGVGSKERGGDNWAEDNDEDNVDDDGKSAFGLRSTWLPTRTKFNSLQQDEGGRFGVSDSRYDKDGNFADSGAASVKFDDPYKEYSMRRRRRRRRRRRSLESPSRDRQASGTSSKEGDNQKRDNEKASGEKVRRSKSSVRAKSVRKSSDPRINMELMSNWKGRDRKLRRQLRKELRHRARKYNKPPPWQCTFVHKTLLTERGIFPSVLRGGKCSTDKCFYRLYNCKPVKYSVKVLQRDPDRCNPLPLTANGTIYEERWDMRPYHVNVGCSCASLAESNRSKTRRKN